MIQPQKLARGVLRGQENEIRDALSELLEFYFGDEDNPLNDAIEQVVFNLGGIGGMGVLTVNSKEGFVTLNQDEIPDGTTYKQFSATEKTKLAGIQAGATANDTNTNLRNRSTHTGTQPTSSITDFAESVRTILGAALVGGQNIEVVVDDLANTITVNVVDLEGGGGAVASVNGQVGAVILDADDISDTATTKKFTSSFDQTKLAGIQSGATANSTDAALRSRATHTGTQAASTISDFDVEVANNTTVTANTTARHTHTNKTILDETTAPFTIEAEVAIDALGTTFAEIEHVHTSADVTDLPEAVRDTIGTTLQEGSNVTIDVDDDNNIITISAVVEAGTGEVNSVNGATGVVTLDQDDIPDGTTFKQYSTGDKTKLAGIAAGATVNATDAALRDRSTHTGTQTASTISDFQTAVSANTDVEDALDAAHAHSNKTILDNTTASFTTADETAIDGLATTYAPIAHDHDGRYFTETEVNTALALKSDTSHNHDSDYSDIAHDHDLDYSDIDHTHADIALNTAARHTHDNKAVLDATTASFLTADETKLDGIATGATANATNAFLLDRANHTGTQDVSSIEGLEIYALADHDHDDLYPTEAELADALALKSDATHNHSGTYAPLAHNHDASYAALAHNHDADYADIVHNHDDLYYTEDEVDLLLVHDHDADYAPLAHNHAGVYAPVLHSHDDLYFTESEVTTALSGKANTSHSHTAANVTDFDTEVSNNTDVAANTTARHTHSNAAVLNATTASFLTADETKLDGIATGATANATDAQLRDRATHTGTQAASTISDFQTTVSANTDVTANASARHTHSNSAVLNATTASFLTADETKLDGIEALADVTDATNVDAAGAVMNSDTTIAAMGFVLNENNMASNSATKVPTQASVKAYADTKAASVHSHDDLYFTESEVTTALSGKASTSHTHGVTDLTATGTRDSTTYLRGDNTWATPAGGSGGGSRSTHDFIIRNNAGTYEAYDNAGTLVTSNAALHTVFNAVKAANKSIYMLAGAYTATSTLDLLEGMTLEGAGLSTQITKTSSGGLVRVVGTSGTYLNNVLVKDIWVTGSSTSGAQVSGSGIYLRYVNNSRVEGCFVNGFGSLGDDGGIEVQEGTGNRVVYNRCWGNKNGICAGSPGSATIIATDLLFEGNTCYNNFDDGLHSQRCSRVRYINNTAYGQPSGGATDGAGIDLLGDEYDSVVGNICYGNGRGLEIGNTSTSPGDKGHTVTGNVLTGNTEYGMTMIGAAVGIQVVGNTFTNNLVNGIRLGTATSANAVSDVTISDNFFRDNGAAGIDSFGYVSKYDILHNNFAGHTTADIRVRTSTGTPATYTIEGNRFQSTTTVQDTVLAADAIIRNNRGYGGGGTTVTRLTASTTYDPASLSTNVSLSTTVTVTGAVVGDPAYASHTGVGSSERVLLYARVTSTNTVTVIFHNSNGGTLNVGSGTLRVDVLQFS